jgi:hypothetical protein
LIRAWLQATCHDPNCCIDTFGEKPPVVVEYWGKLSNSSMMFGAATGFKPPEGWGHVIEEGSVILCCTKCIARRRARGEAV